MLAVVSLGLESAAATSKSDERFDTGLRSKFNFSKSRKRMMNSNSQGIRGKWARYSKGFLGLRSEVCRGRVS